MRGGGWGRIFRGCVALGAMSLVCSCDGQARERDSQRGVAAGGAEALPVGESAILISLSEGIESAAPRLIVLSGTQVTVVVAGEPQGRATWQLVFEDTVLAEGALALDEEGIGRCRLAAPDVRVRTECRWVFAGRAARRSAALVVLPQTALGPSAGRIAARRVGVIDPRGQVQQALRREGVQFADLASEIQRRFFDGGTLIVAAHEEDVNLATVIQGTEKRLLAGLSLVILNPPPGWQGWGVTSVRAPEPVTAPPRLGGGFGQTVLESDLGPGPWRRVLETGPEGRVLIGLAAEGSSPSGGAFGLAVARRVGRGWAVAAVHPELDRPATEACGRAILDDLILWTLANP